LHSLCRRNGRPSFRNGGRVGLSVYARGLLEKAHREIEINFKETGFKETNLERQKREEKKHGR
jgi:hypothetical protein